MKKHSRACIRNQLANIFKKEFELFDKLRTELDYSNEDISKLIRESSQQVMTERLKTP